jgi:hypothetical protein
MLDKDAPPPEPTYFADPAMDRIMGVVLAMATELFVTRDRLHALEKELATSGHLKRAELDAEPQNDAARQKDVEDFVRGLFAPVLGVRTARGP